MRIGYIQTEPVVGRKRDNIDQAEALIEKAEADLLVLPELFSTGYFYPDKKSIMRFSESVPDGHTVKLFRKLARRKSCAFVFGMAEKKSGKCYNSAVYVSHKGDISLYRKVHLFYKERFIFEKGNLKFRAVPFYEYRLGMMICFDYIFPEVCRVLALKGANLICHPSNLVLHYCQKAMPIRSIENRVFTITANRVGTDSLGDEILKFTGMSQITDSEGNVLAQALKTKPSYSVVDVDLNKSLDKMPTKYNHLFKDRRPEFYKDLLI